MLITAHSYGDDSSDETRQRVFTVAAVVASEPAWKDLEGAWVYRNCGFPFHASDCDSNQGIYKNRPNSANKDLYADCIKLLAQSGAWGYGVSVDLAGHREFFPGVDPQMYYHWCFVRVVHYLTEFFGSRRIADKIEFNFDSRMDACFNASSAYALMAADDSFPYRHIMADKVSFLVSTQNPRIQVGDLYARECMKHLDNTIGPTKRPERRSFITLRETQRFGADMFVRESFEDIRRKWDELQKRAGFSFEEYEAWLKENNRVNNISNQFQFLAWLDIRDAKRKQ